MSLILTRKIDEEIVISLTNGQQIYVKVYDIQGRNVKLGFIAPKEIIIHRKEVQERIKKGNEEDSGNV